MKMRRIPETDLARITVLSAAEQPFRLRKLKGFKPPHTLNPFRKVLPDLMNLQHQLLGTVKTTAWEHIEASIRASNESVDGICQNLAVAKALYDFAASSKVVSYDKPVQRWPVGFENSVEYWQPFYSVWSERATFVHFDPRLSNPLTNRARRFVFSMMHQRLRVDDPDFSGVGLTIFQFGVGDDGNRSVCLHSSEEFELYSRDELNDMIDLTYRLWAEELQERREEGRKGTGTDNPMGF